jgi:hemin uptake protein HemP
MNANDHPQSQKPDSKGDQSVDAPKVVKTHDLFNGQREICIEHEGEQYRLRITRRNKLILQK